MNSDTRKLLEAVQQGAMSVDEALLAIKKEPFADIGYAKVDMHRGIRQGAAEVIYGAGKTVAQMIGIVGVMRQHGQKTILITRLSPESAAEIAAAYPLDYHDDARCGIIGAVPEPDGIGRIVIATGGTSDIPVAEEAALTAEFLGSRVVRYRDCGVAGLHRLVSHLDSIRQATALVAVAGMEGALPSVLAGLVKAPVIAVPTSVGYGANFRGVTTLLAMMNSCANGVSVVNIDNGFGAGFNAHLINSLASRPS